jgi:hypothetical protein
VAARGQATPASPHQAAADHTVGNLVCKQAEADVDAERIPAEGTAGTQAAVG